MLLLLKENTSESIYVNLTVPGVATTTPGTIEHIYYSIFHRMGLFSGLRRGIRVRYM